MINDLPMDVNKWYICLLAPISWIIYIIIIIMKSVVIKFDSLDQRQSPSADS